MPNGFLPPEASGDPADLAREEAEIAESRARRRGTASTVSPGQELSRNLRRAKGGSDLLSIGLATLADIAGAAKAAYGNKEAGPSALKRLMEQEQAQQERELRQRDQELAENRDARDEIRFRIEMANALRQKPEDTVKSLKAMTDLNAALIDQGATPDQRRFALEGLTNQLDIPALKEIIPGLLGNDPDLRSLGPLIDLVKDAPGAGAFLLRARTDFRKDPKKFVAGLREMGTLAAEDRARPLLREMVPATRELLKQPTGDLPWDAIERQLRLHNPEMATLVGRNAGLLTEFGIAAPTIMAKAAEAKAVEIGKQAGKLPEAKTELGKIETDIALFKKQGLGEASPIVKGLRQQMTDLSKPEALSPVAKLQRDLENAGRLYGPESAQTKTLQAVLDAETQGKAVTGADKLRGEFTKLSSPFIVVRDAFQRVESAAQTPTAAGDLALIFGYMKLLDPGSTVREGEFATAASAAGVPERVWNLYNRVMTGQRLTPEQRQDFAERGRDQFRSQLASHQRLEQEFRRLATQQKIAPEDVIIDFAGPLRQGPMTGETSGVQIRSIRKIK